MYYEVVEHYFDYAASAPLRQSAYEVYCQTLPLIGNASSIHHSGRRLRRIVEVSREKIAQLCDADPTEVIFTSGGTESNNIAIQGQYQQIKRLTPEKDTIICSAAEHHAVLKPVEKLQQSGANVVLLNPNSDGFLDPAVVIPTLEQYEDRVALVCAMTINNETGARTPIEEIASYCASRDIPLHSDAVASIGHENFSFKKTNASSVAGSAHKFGGPTGIGLLFAQRNIKLDPILHGGGHERSLRAGSYNVAAIAAAAQALEEAIDTLNEQRSVMQEMRHALIKGITQTIPDAIINGAQTEFEHSISKYQHPSIVSVSFPGCEGDSLLMLLDAQNIYCSTGAACSAGVSEASHVLLSMGLPASIARSTLRFSFGEKTELSSIKQLITILPEVVIKARYAGLS